MSAREILEAGRMWRAANLARRCYYCGVMFGGARQGMNRLSPRSKTRDHMVPASRGASLRGNVVAACAWCNGLKADRDVGEFRRHLKSLNPAWDGRFAAEIDVQQATALWFGPPEADSANQETQ